MIQIYTPDNIDFDSNGDMTLFPESCKIKAVLNGEWYLEIAHPIDEDNRWQYIEEEAVLKVDSFLPEKQLFRISKPVRSESGISATAYPIFFDAAKDCFLVDVRPTKANGQEALLAMCAPNAKYTAVSDIAMKNTAYYVRKNLLNAISGSEENSFLNRWGGEIIYNNYTIQINQRAGSDQGYRVCYGKNLTGLSKTVEMDDVITRIIPVSYNGYMLEGDQPWVDSPVIDKYPIIYYREVKFDEVKLAADAGEGEAGFDTMEELRAELVRQCEQMFAEGCDKPMVTLKISMAELSGTEEYKDFIDLESVSLGDDVYCSHKKLGITTKARCTQLVYDCIRKQVESVTLGDYVPNVFDRTTSIINKVNAAIKEDGSIVAEQVKGILNAMETSLKLQSTAAKKVSGRAFLIEDTDPESELYGAMEAGTQGLRIAKEKDAEGKWRWDTAITASGGVMAALITGLLSDKTGQNYWDLDQGNFVMENGKIYLKGQKIFQASDYTDADKTICRSIVDKETAVTSEYLDKYDINADGNITAADYVKVSKLAAGTVDSYTVDTSVEISSGSLDGTLVRLAGVAMRPFGIWSQNLSCDSLSVTDLIHVEEVSLTLSANSYVSPYTYFGSFNVTSGLGEVIAVYASGAAGEPLPCVLTTDRKTYRIVGSGANVTARVVYLKV